MAAGSRLPVGMKFHPSERELVGFYLFNKINSKTDCFNDLEKKFVKDCDLYGCEEPWQIWESYGGHQLEDGEALHLFTRLKKVSVRGSRVSRRVGSGTWAGEDSGDQIVVGDVVCIKKRFRYENQHSPQHDGAWIMHEFNLNDSDIVLCRLRRNLSGGRRGPEKKRKRNSKQVDSCASKRALVSVQENQARADSCDSSVDEIPHVMPESQTDVVFTDSSTTTLSDSVYSDDNDHRLTTQFDWVDAADDDVLDGFLNNLTWPDLDITYFDITDLFES
ncbi:hypothetical protein Ddye_015401 [Dipteronia dyeriana]|uniref:NAC domain-containing protein n=1 Tax=Dipteronia dyeriana TaxID=168575 RepID=A0AAD9WZA0_9ROSI|nr:hypothetical protein Ddye_015401 [Dipteronia dyeriana]